MAHVVNRCQYGTSLSYEWLAEFSISATEGIGEAETIQMLET